MLSCSRLSYGLYGDTSHDMSSAAVLLHITHVHRGTRTRTRTVHSSTYVRVNVYKNMVLQYGRLRH